MEKIVLSEMFENLVHIGNRKNYWNPKMKSYIYASINGVHIINLIETLKQIQKAKAEIGEYVKQGKKILFVGTKIQSRDLFKSIAEKTGNFYVCKKWIPGLLTNFKTIKKRIQYYLELERSIEEGKFEWLSKKEKNAKIKEYKKLQSAFEWLKTIQKLPDIVFVSDGVYEKQCLLEAKKLSIRSYAIMNTNGDIDIADVVIPANTNFIRSYECIISQLEEVLIKNISQTHKKESIHIISQRKISGDKNKKTFSQREWIKKEYPKTGKQEEKKRGERIERKETQKEETKK